MAGLNKTTGSWIDTITSVLDGSFVPKRKCRWLCKITRGIVQGIGSAVGGIVGTAISNAAGAIAFRESIDDYVTDLTAAEQDLLKAWSEKHFIPFYEKLAKKASQIEVATSLQSQLHLINQLEAQFSLVLANLQPNLNGSSSGLSALAQQEMYDYAEDNFAVIQEVYAQIIAQIPNAIIKDVEVFMKDYDFNPLITALYPVTSAISTVFKVADISPLDTALPIDEDTSINQNNISDEKGKSLSWIEKGGIAFGLVKIGQFVFKKRIINKSK